MVSSSGNSSGSTQLRNSGSEEELQVLMNQRKRKRMESNRESARRSRMRKQKHLDDLNAQMTQLKKENDQILANINITTQQYIKVETQNSVLRAQITELSQRLRSLNDIINYINTATGVLDSLDLETSADQSCMNNPWNLMYVNQPITASADIFQ